MKDNKKLRLILTLLIILMSIVTASVEFYRFRTNQQKMVQNNIPPSTKFETDGFQIETPYLNETVVSPLKIKGSAKGDWYFEGQFSVELLVDGAVLATAPVIAQGDWMTSEYVPFEATLEFTKPQNPTFKKMEALLRFKNANPSGLSENEVVVALPVNL